MSDYQLSITRPADIIHCCTAHMGEQGSNPRGNEAGEFRSAPNVHGQRGARAKVQAGKTVSRLWSFLAEVYNSKLFSSLSKGGGIRHLNVAAALVGMASDYSGEVTNTVDPSRLYSQHALYKVMGPCLVHIWFSNYVAHFT